MILFDWRFNFKLYLFYTLVNRMNTLKKWTKFDQFIQIGMQIGNYFLKFINGYKSLMKLDVRKQL